MPWFRNASRLVPILSTIGVVGSLGFLQVMGWVGNLPSMVLIAPVLPLLLLAVFSMRDIPGGRQT